MGIFYYFLWTLLIELPVVIMFYRRQWVKVLIIGILLNAFTWPLLQLSLEYINDRWVPMLELIIAITEGIGYWIFMKGKLSYAQLAAFLANGLSYGIGFFLN